MNSDCDRFKAAIPMEMAGDLGVSEQEELARHLAECKPCAHERELYAETFLQLRAQENVPVPRHFFVYPKERTGGFRVLLRQLSLAWKVSLATGLLAFGVLASLAVAKLQIRRENGALLVAFGQVTMPGKTAAAQPPIDVIALESRILRAVEEKNREERLEWVRTLKEELSTSQRVFTQKQRRLLESTLNEVETRMGNNVAAASLALENRTNKSLGEMYISLMLQRERDQAAVNRRLTQLAVAGETKSNQTDEILETLLQVAELKMK